MNRDLFNNANPRRVANATIACLDRLQDYQPHEQMLAAAALFVSLADHWKLPAQDAFTVVKNLMLHEDRRRPEFGAVQLYMQNELR
jgi:hypothetical protein